MRLQEWTDRRRFVNQTDVRCCHAGHALAVLPNPLHPSWDLPLEKPQRAPAHPASAFLSWLWAPDGPAQQPEAPPPSGTVRRLSPGWPPCPSILPGSSAQKLSLGLENSLLAGGRGEWVGGKLSLCNHPLLGQRCGERDQGDHAEALGETRSAPSLSKPQFPQLHHKRVCLKMWFLTLQGGASQATRGQ